VDTSENDFDDFYHDDPIRQVPKSKLPSKFIATSALILGSVLFFQGTFAGNISLNSSTGIEFGQGVSQAVACSGETSLTLTPRSSFTNASPGAHYLNSVTVSNIPDSCFGVDFTIRAYDDTSSTPLALFNSTSTNAVVSNNAGTFSPGTGSTGMTVASSAGTFTATFTAPVAQSSSVFKLTIQSGAQFAYKVGDRGPGGGIVYYISTTPNTDATPWRYLEAAPDTWYDNIQDPLISWCSNSTNFVPPLVGPPASPATIQTSIAIGAGSSNTQKMLLGCTSGAANTVAAYRGGGQSDWFLPSKDELKALHSVRATAGLGVFRGVYAYWSSSEFSATNALYVIFFDPNSGTVGNYSKVGGLIRPIRAF
jgi:hypothetical protein